MSMLEFKHEWRVEVDPAGEDPALYVHCAYCKAVVEVLMVEAHDQCFLRAHLVAEGAHPVTDEEIDLITRSVYAEYVEPQLGALSGDIGG
ncbi:MAG: hypothetical protein M3281_04690 [Chloroflexota bacterium]|nr:hypothetical protein [Chloroflexota bacterium]